MAEPTPEQFEAMLKDLLETDVTKSTHHDLYPALSLSKPELSQAGRTVLITGGGTNVGYGIARAFLQASARTIIILGRREDVLESAKGRLEEDAKKAGTQTSILRRTCNITEKTQVEELWKWLADEGHGVDIFVANAAKFSDPRPIFELGADEVWSQVETNAKAPLYFAEKFYNQLGDKKGFIVNVSSQIIHTMANPGVAVRPAYTLSKMTGALVFQLIAQNTPVEKLQIVSFHPGLIYNGEWEKMGVAPERLDKDELCGAFAVWLASQQAAFLHGRYTIASWDVEELSNPSGPLRQRIEHDPYFLRGSIVGLNTMNLA